MRSNLGVLVFTMAVISSQMTSMNCETLERRDLATLIANTSSLLETTLEDSKVVITKSEELIEYFIGEFAQGFINAGDKFILYGSEMFTDRIRGELKGRFNRTRDGPLKLIFSHIVGYVANVTQHLELTDHSLKYDLVNLNNTYHDLDWAAREAFSDNLTLAAYDVIPILIDTKTAELLKDSEEYTTGMSEEHKEEVLDDLKKLMNNCKNHIIDLMEAVRATNNKYVLAAKGVEEVLERRSTRETIIADTVEGLHAASRQAAAVSAHGQHMYHIYETDLKDKMVDIGYKMVQFKSLTLNETAVESFKVFYSKALIDHLKPTIDSIDHTAEEFISAANATSYDLLHHESHQHLAESYARMNATVRRYASGENFTLDSYDSTQEAIAKVVYTVNNATATHTSTLSEENREEILGMVKTAVDQGRKEFIDILDMVNDLLDLYRPVAQGIEYILAHDENNVV